MKFELSRLATNCSNEEIIAEIQRVDSLINKKWLSRTDFDRVAKVNSVTVIKRFSSFKQALTIAGLEHKHTDQPEIRRLYRQKVTNEQLVTEAQKIANQLGREGITREEFRRYSTIKITPDAVGHLRFGSWANFMEASGLRVSYDYRRLYSNEDYFENLLKVWTHHGKQPFRRELDE